MRPTRRSHGKFFYVGRDLRVRHLRLMPSRGSAWMRTYAPSLARYGVTEPGHYIATFQPDPKGDVLVKRARRHSGTLVTFSRPDLRPLPSSVKVCWRQTRRLVEGMPLLKAGERVTGNLTVTKLS